VIFSAHGLRDTAGCQDHAEGLRRIVRRTNAYVSVTTGPEGVLWLEDGRVQHAPAHRVSAVDTLGAGDVYHGAFALALGEGQDAKAAMRFAGAAAALKCTRFGGIAGAPSRAEVLAFLASQ
jgi:sulfofructose kinase